VSEYVTRQIRAVIYREDVEHAKTASEIKSLELDIKHRQERLVFLKTSNAERLEGIEELKKLLEVAN
jgi:hypothetical protein